MELQLLGGTMVRTSDETNGKRVKRLLQIMFLLQESDSRSSDQLAKRFHVSRRTIYRDIQVLRDAGIPISPGTNGVGYCLRGNDLRIAQLQPLELIAVASCDEPAISGLSFLRHAREVALAKMASGAATFSKPQIQYVLDRLADLQLHLGPVLSDEGALEALVESWIRSARVDERKPASA